MPSSSHAFLYRDRINVQQTISTGAGSGVGSLAATAVIMGFWRVAAAYPAYKSLTDALVNMKANPLITSLISINVIAAITGSSNGDSTYSSAAWGNTLMMLLRVTYYPYHR